MSRDFLLDMKLAMKKTGICAQKMNDESNNINDAVDRQSPFAMAERLVGGAGGVLLVDVKGFLPLPVQAVLCLLYTP